MRPGLAIKVALLAAIVGGAVAVVAFFFMERVLPGDVTIGPGSGGQIVVVIDGAVATPGVVSLPVGSRLTDAVNAAGGFLETADTTSLNLAGRIGDGEHITIPVIREPGESSDPLPGATPALSSSLVTAGLININTAGASELDQLPGIGPVIAQRIVDFREFYGPFESVDQLVEVDGISQDMVEEFRHMVTIGG